MLIRRQMCMVGARSFGCGWSFIFCSWTLRLHINELLTLLQESQITWGSSRGNNNRTHSWNIYAGKSIVAHNFSCWLCDVPSNWSGFMYSSFTICFFTFLSVVYAFAILSLRRSLVTGHHRAISPTEGGQVRHVISSDQNVRDSS